MAQDEQFVFAFGDRGLGFDAPLSTKLEVGRHRFMEELNAERASLEAAWHRVERAVSAFAHIPQAMGG